MIPRRTPLRRWTPLRQRAKTAGRPWPKRTGPDGMTRDLVLERDGYLCVSCGIPVTGRQYSLQHRKARGVGGGNEPSNLITLCGSATSPGCHLAAEQRLTESRDLGYWVPSWQDPRTVPVMHARLGLVYLDDYGRYSYEPPNPQGDPS